MTMSMMRERWLKRIGPTLARARMDHGSEPSVPFQAFLLMLLPNDNAKQEGSDIGAVHVAAASNSVRPH